MIVADSKESALKMFRIDVNRFHDTKSVRLWEGTRCELPNRFQNDITRYKYEDAYRAFGYQIGEWFDKYLEGQRFWDPAQQPVSHDFDNNDYGAAFQSAIQKWEQEKEEAKQAAKPLPMFIFVDQMEEDDFYERMDEDTGHPKFFLDYSTYRRYRLPYDLRAYWESLNPPPEMKPEEEDFEPFWTVQTDFGHHCRGLMFFLIVKGMESYYELAGRWSRPTVYAPGGEVKSAFMDSVHTFQGVQIPLWEELNEVVVVEEKKRTAPDHSAIEYRRQVAMAQAQEGEEEITKLIAAMEEGGFKLVGND